LITSLARATSSAAAEAAAPVGVATTASIAVEDEASACFIATCSSSISASRVVSNPRAARKGHAMVSSASWWWVSSRTRLRHAVRTWRARTVSPSGSARSARSVRATSRRTAAWMIWFMLSASAMTGR
jgi:hypothetical protein